MRKGFTLVELLAVIVILAIIALITVPIIMNIVESSKKATSVESANGYVRAVTNYLIMNVVDDGVYSVFDSNIKAEYTGTKVSNGSITIEKGDIKKANLCINDYSIDYINGVSSISNNDYCKDTNNKTLILNKDGKELKSIYIGESTSTEIEKEDVTNIVCNNGVTIKEENGKIKVENILSNSECNFNSNLEDVINNIDNTTNNILLLNDIELGNTLTILEGKDIVLDLNGKNVTGTSLITNKGVLTINDSLKTGSLIAKETGIMNSSNGVLNLNDINMEANTTTIQNNDSANINIDGGKYVSNSVVIINFSSGNINIKDESDRVYIYTTFNDSIWSAKSISNNRAGDISINGSVADKCTSAEENTSGICIYNVNGRTILSDAYTTGNIYINGASIVSEKYVAVDNGPSKVYICNAKINGNIYDIRNSLEGGYVYYTDSVILETGKTSDTKNEESHIILNNEITCE